jgi:hypothetical protein
MRFLICLIAMTMLPGELPAASATIRFRTLCLRHQDEVRQLFAAGPDGKTLQPVPLFAVHSSPATMRTTDGNAVFLLPDGLTPDGKPQYKTAASAKVSGAGEFLFLFLPAGKDAAQPYKVVTLPEDSRAFPYGNLLLLNLAGVAVRFHLGEFSGENAITLKPGDRKMVERVRQVDAFNMYHVVTESRIGDRFVPFSSTRWKSLQGRRDLVIIHLDPLTRKPLVNLYKDAELSAPP